MVARDSTVPTFDGSGDVRRFLLQFESLDDEDDRLARLLPGYLQGNALDFYCKRFCDEQYRAKKEARTYGTVRQALIDRYAKAPKMTARMHLERAMNYKYKGGDLEEFLEEAEELYKSAKVDTEMKFELLQTALEGTDFPLDVLIVSNPTNYEDLKKLVLNTQQIARGLRGHPLAGPKKKPEELTRDEPVEPREKDKGPRREPSNLEAQIRSLERQIEQLTLVVTQSKHCRSCRLCGEDGHLAYGCPKSQRKEDTCDYCKKKGHVETDCFRKARDERERKGTAAVAPVHDDSKENQTPAALAVSEVKVSKDTKADDAKKVEDVQAFGDSPFGQQAPAPMEPDGFGRPNMGTFTNYTNPFAPQPQAPEPPRTQAQRRKKTKKGPKGTSLVKELSARSSPYDPLRAIAQAPSGLTVGQLLRGDAVTSAKTLRKYFGRSMSAKVAAVGEPGEQEVPRRHQTLLIGIYGHPVRALFDTGAVPNVMSERLAKALGLKIGPTDGDIRVASGDVVTGEGVVKGVPVTLDTIVVPVDFVVLRRTLFDVLLGLPALTALQAQIDLAGQVVTVEYEGETIQMPTEYYPTMENPDSDCDSEFTTTDDATSEYVGALSMDRPNRRARRAARHRNRRRSRRNNEQLVRSVGAIADGRPDRARPSEARRVWEALPESLQQKLTHLAPDFQEAVAEVVLKHDVVAQSLSDLRPASVPTVHHFTLTDYRPIRQKVRRMHPDHQEIVKDQIDKMLKAGIIKPVESEWAFPITLADKADGTKRLCVDFRALNDRMERDSWPLPNIDEILDSLGGCSVFTTLDLFSGYWQIRLSPECQKYATFICKFGTYCFLVTPFGLRNAPATFQRMMQQLFGGADFVLVYLDDVVIFSRNYSTHIQHLETVFERLAKHGLKIKISKCHFMQPQVKLLGHIVGREGIRTDPEKVRAIVQFPTPTDLRALRSFLGLTSYYRRFVERYAERAKPLYLLTKGDQPFSWGPEAQATFDALKECMTTPPVLRYPDYDVPFMLSTDASNVALGAILEQRDEEGRVHPVAYASRVLAPAERNYTVTEREGLAVVFALKKFRHYLLPRTFHLFTDHQALRGIFNKPELTGRLARWLTLLSEFSYETYYRPGRANPHADALSRVPAGLHGRWRERTPAPLSITAESPPEPPHPTNERQCDVHSAPSARTDDPSTCQSEIGPALVRQESATLGTPPAREQPEPQDEERVTLAPSFAEQIEAYLTGLPMAATMDHPHARDVPPPTPTSSGPLSHPSWTSHAITIPDDTPQPQANREETEQEPPATQPQQGIYEEHLLRIWRFLRLLRTEADDPEPDKTRRNARRFCVIDHTLYRRTPQGARFVPDIRARSGILKAMHDNNGHFDSEATYLLLRGRVWWPNLYREVRNYVRACHNCQRRQPFGSEVVRNPPSAPISGLWDTVSIDFAGPLPVTAKGNRYLLIAVEHLTGWPIARALPSAISTGVTSFVEEKICNTYATPKVIVSDNGAQFTSLHVRHFAADREIEWRTVAAYNPQGNGRAERMVRTIKDALAKMVADEVHLWDTHLDTVLWGYRTRCTWRQPSPYYLMFGAQPRLLMGYNNLPPTNRAESMRAIECAEVVAARDARVTPGSPRPNPRFSVGDQVLLARSQNRNRRDRRLALRWDGPFTIADARPPVYLLRERSKRSRAYIHERRLRPYFSATGTVGS